MKINPLNIIFSRIIKIRKNNLNKTIYYEDKTLSTRAHYDATSEVFTKLLQELEFFSNFLEGKGKVTKNAYLDIVKNHPTTLCKANEMSWRNYYGKLRPENLASVAIKTDKYLKENYKDFRIISIGTSPAALCEQLEALGNEVIYLPASGVAPIDELCDMPDIKTAIAYLKYQGIDNSKLNLVLDYTSSGTTLRTVAALVKKQLNIQRDKIRFLSLENLLDTVFMDYPEDKSKKYFIHDADGSLIEEISNVPHFPVTQNAQLLYKNRKFTIIPAGKFQKEIFKEFDEASNPLARAFSLSTMHEINKK